MDVILAIAPVFGVMVLGHILFRLGLPGDSFWVQADRLVYWVLIPALLFHMNSTAEFGGERIRSFAIVLISAFFLVAALAFVTCRILRIGPDETSSVLQGSVRHNAFIALALCESLYGKTGLETATLATAILALVTNVSIVPMMIGLLPKPEGMSIGARVLKDTVRNPVVLAICLGLLTNLATDARIPFVHSMTALLGNAALPLMLLCVGASVSFNGARGKTVPLVLSMVGKFAVFPLLVLGLAMWADLSKADIIILVIFGSISTASSALTLARQLGGDAPLMSTIIAVHTIFAFVSLPVTLILTGTVLG